MFKAVIIAISMMAFSAAAFAAGSVQSENPTDCPYANHGSTDGPTLFVPPKHPQVVQSLPVTQPPKGPTGRVDGN